MGRLFLICYIRRGGRRLLLDVLYKAGEIILDLLYQERGKGDYYWMCCIRRERLFLICYIRRGGRRLLLDELYKDGEIILDLLYQEKAKEIITGCVV